MKVSDSKKDMVITLKDKVTIITGSARGIGREYALRFSTEGAKVVLCDIRDSSDTAEEIKSMGGEVLSLITDVSNEQSTVEMAKKTVERFGRIDVLVNNAAHFPGKDNMAEMLVKPFHELTVEDWDGLMAVNLKGVFLCCKAVIPYMKEQRKGKIINITSIATFIGSPPAHYAASKGGVYSFTRVLARELGQYGINVNAMAPGPTQTKDRPYPEEVAAPMIAGQCIKLQEEPKHLLGMLVLLASDESDFITGQHIVVDGGTHLH